MGLAALKVLISKLSSKPSAGNGSSNELHGLLPERMFLRALCLERKRAERSRKLFVLMLLDLGKSSDNGNGDNTLLQRTVPAILSSIRETDIAGWHKEDAPLGGIFAELGAGDTTSIVPALRGRITSWLPSFLHPEAHY